MKSKEENILLILAFETSAKAASVALMDGDLEEIINALATADQAEKLKNSK